MFENDYAITGKHATYLKHLVNDIKIFDRYIDVYMNGAIFGLLYGRSKEKDNSSTDRANILAAVFSKERNNCVFLYRLAMLLDEETKLKPEDRIDRAFRDDAKEKNDEKMVLNMNIFHNYIRGGIEVLYENYSEGCSTQDDYLDRIYELMCSFKEEIEGISYEEKLENLMRG